MIYNIAGIKVDMDLKYPRLKKQSEAYIDNSAGKVNVRIRIDEKSLKILHENHPHLTLEECEYIWTGSEFYNCLPEFDGFLLHSSAVVYNDEAFLFSAPCGTGKSTHTQLWLKRFPGAYILNDDKPAIRLENDRFYAYGTPFSGKTDLNVNKKVPLKGVCILERSEKNAIERISPDEALFALLNQTVRPDTDERMDKLLNILDKLVDSVKMYRLKCNMDIEAAEVAYKGMKSQKKEELL